MSDTKAIADEIYKTIQDSVASAKLVEKDGHFDLSSIRTILSTIDIVLTEVEKLSKDVSVGTLSGSEKKEIAVNVLTRLLSFDIPWVPNFLEDKIKSAAISFVIDYSVEFLNKKLGKNWLQ